MNIFEDIGKDDCILFLGEGNFSFSANVIQNLETSGKDVDYCNIYTTCYQSADKDATATKTNNIDYLRSKGVNVLYNVDATNMEGVPDIKDVRFNKIIFMFPHIGGKMKIHLNRELIHGFLVSVQNVIADSGLVIITLCKGQGGTPLDPEVRRKADTWKVLDIAQDNNFMLTDIFNFPAQNFKNYCQVGYRSLQKGFNIQDSMVHVLLYRPTPVFTPAASLDQIRIESTPEREAGEEDLVGKEASQCSSSLVNNSPENIIKSIDCLTLEADQNLDKVSEERVSFAECEARKDTKSEPLQLCPLIHTHHLSFWYNEPVSLDDLHKVARACLGDIVVDVKFLSEFTDGKRLSKTFEITYKSVRFPLGPKKAFELHYNVLGKSLVNLFQVELR